MTSSWGRRGRRILVTGSLVAALAAAFTVAAGPSFAAPRSAQAGPLAGPVEQAPNPTPAGVQYGKPPGYKSMCKARADGDLAAAIDRAKKARRRATKRCDHSTRCVKRAKRRYNNAVKAAQRLHDQTVSSC
jgi:hypothetical protein